MKRFLMFISAGVALWFLCMLMPTDDDWLYLAAPSFDNFWKRMLPNGAFWRPFDALFGSFLGLYVDLFPYLNHFVILLAHCLSAYVLYKILEYFELKKRSVNIAILFYLFSPAMLGTVLSIDSLNQAYASFWGILSLYLFLKLKGIKKNVAWTFCALLALFSKENGVAWLFIPPLIAGINSQHFPWKSIAKYWAFGACVFILYFSIRKAIEINELSTVYLVDPTSPYYFSIKNKIKDVVAFVGGSFFAVDFISILHQPSRNFVIAALTFAASSPFLYILFKHIFIHRKEKYVWIPLFASVIAASLHLATYFGPMHTYAGLSLIALLVGFIVDKIKDVRKVTFCFALFLISALFVDAHHWYCTYQSGKTGMEMGQKVVDRTTVIPDTVLILTVEAGQPQYSSFCIPPEEAYREGHAAQLLYKYQYPKTKIKVFLQQYDRDSITYYVNKYENLCNCVWINYKDSIEVINLR